MCARIFEPEPPDDDAGFPDPELELQELPEVVEVVPQPATKPRDKEFDKLVESALDFLNRALKEVKTEPKYSVIDFFTGVELILKARLLHEHWSLVVAKPGDVSKQKFLEGSFESATRKQCFTRLENVCGETLNEEQACFDQLAERRNREQGEMDSRCNPPNCPEYKGVRSQRPPINHLGLHQEVETSPLHFSP